MRIFTKIEEISIKYESEKLAMATNEEIFKQINVDKIKQIANNTLKILQILLFERPKHITDPILISEILQKTHNNPTGGHIEQNKMYKKLRKEFHWKKMKKKNNFPNCQIL